jgi:hypothetical protein
MAMMMMMIMMMMTTTMTTMTMTTITTTSTAATSTITNATATNHVITTTDSKTSVQLVTITVERKKQYKNTAFYTCTWYLTFSAVAHHNNINPCSFLVFSSYA